MGTQFWTWAEILDQFFKSVFKDTPPHTHHLSRKTVLPPKVRFRWWALKNLETLWFSSALLLSCLLPLWNGRETEKMWNSKVLPYPLLSRCFVVIWQVVPLPIPSPFLHFLHPFWIPFYVIIFFFLKLSASPLKSAESVPTPNSVFGNPHGTCHMGYAILGTHAMSFSNCGRVCHVVRIPLGWLCCM